MNVFFYVLAVLSALVFLVTGFFPPKNISFGMSVHFAIVPHVAFMGAFVFFGLGWIIKMLKERLPEPSIRFPSYPSDTEVLWKGTEEPLNPEERKPKSEQQNKIWDQMQP